MSDRSPKDPFNKAARETGQPHSPKLRPKAKPDHGLPLAPLRDEDNAKPGLKPGFALLPPPRLAPPGMSGIKSGITVNPGSGAQHGLIIDQGDVRTDTRLAGRIEGMQGYTFVADIPGPDVFKGYSATALGTLTLYEHGMRVAHYDQSWDVAPITERQHQALDRTVTGLAQIAEAHKAEERRTIDLSIAPDRFKEEELTEGHFPNRDGMTFTAKVEPNDHPKGLKGGPIRFLDLRDSGRVVARYDDGWVLKPQGEAYLKDCQDVTETLERFNRGFTPIVPKGNDKDHGWER